MNKIIEIEELGFPKSLIIRENALVSELIDTNYLVEELNEQFRKHNVSKSFYCLGDAWGESGNCDKQCEDCYKTIRTTQKKV